MKNDNKLDTKRLNEVIKLSDRVLRIVWILLIIGLFLLLTFLLKEWHVLSFLRAIINVISPLFIGIVVAWLLDPIVSWMQKNGMKRGYSTIIVFLSFISLLVIFFVLMIPSLVDQVNDFISSVPNILDYISNLGDNLFQKLYLIYNYDFTTVKTQIYSSITNLISSITIDLPNTIISFGSTLISGGLNIIFGLFIGFYMLFDFNNVRKHLISFLPKKFHADAISLTDNLNKTLKSYVQGTFLIMVILFVFQSVALGIAGLPSPMLFGLFCAITNVIPYVGPYIGGIPAVVVGFTISPMTGIGCLIAVIVAQLLESYFLNPIVMSKTMKLHPVTIMIGLLIFGHFFGMLGMILATPIISCLKIIATFVNDKYELLDKINK